MPSVFKIYILGISELNMVWRSDKVSETTGYGDSILSPKLKKEINKADGFDFMILPSNSFYDSFEKKKTLVYVTRDDKCIFRGRVSDIKTDIFKQRTINCEGDLAFLADSIQSPNKRTDTSKAGDTDKQKRTTKYYGFDGSSGTSDDKIKMSVESYFRGLIGEHNAQMLRHAEIGSNVKAFTVGEITVSKRGDTEKFERTSFQDTSSIISSDLLSIYGGVLRTRFENNTAYIDWLDDYTVTSRQDIRFGVNLVELNQEPPSDSVWSVLIPVGDDNLTIEQVNGNLGISTTELLNTYGYIAHYHQFNDIKNATELQSKADQYLNTHGRIFPDNIIVKAIDLQLIGESNDPLELGEKIKVVSEPHGLEKTMSCIAMELDIYNPENNSYTIGTIMPPDKEKKKDSLSSQQAESSSSHSRGINNNANKIGKMNEDINVNANNINVNAKNIAVNALNIAVNAENIAIVAKNIAIAAETIDIKTRELSVEFGDKMDDLYGYIHASAEGIKTAFSDNTTGLSSYFSQTAGEISAGVSNAEGTISSKISLTEEHLTSEFNKKIYGENGQGGLVADYSSKITQSATRLSSEFNMTLYGEGGSYDDPTGGLVKEYRSKIEQSAKTLTSQFNTKIYGEGGTAEDPKAGGIIHDYESKIEQESTSIKTTVSNKLYGENGTESDPTGGIVKEYRSSITQLSGEISLRVKSDEVVSTINIQPDNIRIQAKKIELEGKVLADYLSSTYATIGSLNTTNANISNLTSGSTKATHLNATTLSAETLQVYRSAGTASGYQIYYPSMVKRGESSYYSNYVLSTNSSGELDLSHSHSVSTDTNGTITLGGAVSVSDAGSFRIADTKTYKDGVSAARIEGINSVTVTAVGYDTVSYPSSYVSYNSSYKRYDVKIRGVASNGNFKQNSLTIDAESAYNAGYNAGYSDGVAKGREGVSVSNIYINSVYASQDSGDNIYDCANITLTVYLSNSKQESKTFENVAMWQVYDCGRRDAILNDSYCEKITVSSDGSGHATIAAWLPNWDRSDWTTYRHYVSCNDVTDNHN